jgi:outer membrane protein
MRTSFLTVLLLSHSILQAQQPLTLEQCVQRAEERNLTMRNAALDGEIAMSNAEQAKWDLLPNLNAAGTHGYNYGRVVDRFTNTFATDRVRTNNFFLSSDLSLFEGFRKQNTLRQARLQETAALKGYEAARNDIRTQVANAFLNVLALRERVRMAEAQIATTTEQIDRVQQLVDAGLSPRAEVLNLISQRAQEEFTRTDLLNQLDLALLDLASLMQLTPEEAASLNVMAPGVELLTIAEPTQQVETVLAEVLRNNPAYAQAELNVESAERGIAVARSGVMPSLVFSASAGTGYSGRNFEAIGDPIIGPPALIGFTGSGEEVFQPTLDFETRTKPFGTQLDDNLNESLGFTLSVPLFNNMRNRMQVDQARIRKEQALNQREQRRVGIQREVLNAITAQRAAYRQYESARRATEAADEALRYAQERFAAGAINAVELTTAKNIANRSAADVINARYNYLMALKSLEILQGLPITL